MRVDCRHQVATRRLSAAALSNATTIINRAGKRRVHGR